VRWSLVATVKGPRAHVSITVCHSYYSLRQDPCPKDFLGSSIPEFSDWGMHSAASSPPSPITLTISSCSRSPITGGGTGTSEHTHAPEQVVRKERVSADLKAAAAAGQIQHAHRGGLRVRHIPGNAGKERRGSVPPASLGCTRSSVDGIVAVQLGVGSCDNGCPDRCNRLRGGARWNAGRHPSQPNHRAGKPTQPEPYFALHRRIRPLPSPGADSSVSIGIQHHHFATDDTGGTSFRFPFPDVVVRLLLPPTHPCPFRALAPPPTPLRSQWPPAQQCAQTP
jgi:hypothetical protein